MIQVLKVENLVKKYKKTEAVKGISFEVNEGEIFALVGPNGAGKSTALKMIATILTPTSGKITVLGLDASEKAGEIRQHMSYLPEEAGAYKNLTGRQYLEFMAEVFYADKIERKKAVAFAGEINGLGERLKDKVQTYSKGMARKLLLSRAVMTKPRLAIMDEPTSGLDVLNAVEIRNTLRKLVSEGVSILLSSHNMLEIEYLSDRMAIINKGVIMDSGTVAGLKSKYSAANLEEVFVKLNEKAAA